MAGNHPGGCTYYRIEAAGRSAVYALDCELTADLAERLTAFAQGSDLLIWDAGFTEADFRPGWGHATWRQGLDLGRAAGVKKVLMAHYSRNYSDAFLEEQEALARQTDSRVQFAREGKVAEL